MQVYMRNENLGTRGLLPVLEGSAVLRLNGVSTFSFVVDANTDTWRRFRPGWGVYVDEGEGRVLSGPVTRIVTTRGDRGRELEISGVSDEVLLENRLTTPSPARAAEEQDEDAYYVRRNQPAETIMRNLVAELLGPGARAEYRIDDLVVPASQGRGATVSVNTRWKVLLDEMQSLASAGGVNFRIDQQDKTRVLSFYEGRDLSRAVRIKEIGSYELTQEAPEVTEVIVAGQGQGAGRNIRQIVGNESPWGGYIQRFQDRRDTDENEDLSQAGLDTLAEGQEQASLTFEAHDQPGRKFLSDFGLGDTVTVKLDTGVDVTDIVQSAELSWGSTGRTVKLQVGPVQNEDNAPTWVKPVRDIARRLRGLEGI